MSGFGLANPWLLGALAVLAVPVLLHLVIREDRRGVGFPSLMFIPRTPYRARRRRTLRDKALLALRCLALLALILAFAGPQLLDTAPAPIAAGPRHDSVLLVDRSYSMSPARRWAALQQAASDTIDAADTDTRVALLAFDHRTRLVAPFSSDRDELRRRLTDLSPSAGGTGFANAFDAATRLLGESTADRRSIVLFSDLQQSALVDLDRLRLPAGVEVRVVPIETPIGANAALLDAVLLDASDTAVANHGPTDASRAEPPPDPLAGPLERGVRIRIASTGDQPLTETRLGVRLDDAPPTSLSIQLAPGQTRELDVPVVLARDRAQVLHLSLGDDAIAADNTLTLVLQPDRPVRVALPGPATQTARPDRTAPIYARHLTHALAVAGER
ncbi:MAG: BatA and WFA domain-containing protein, partial [Gammaproteobacteria bacterium]|nr:BatA and WFA domain-containing protein [Gammaproteobacteria bacterium]